jgi:hypothetical protein
MGGAGMGRSNEDEHANPPGELCHRNANNTISRATGPYILKHQKNDCVHQSVYRPGVKLLFKKKKKHQSKN